MELTRNELVRNLISSDAVGFPDEVIADIAQAKLEECIENSVNWIGRELQSFDICVSAEENNRIFYLNKLLNLVIKKHEITE